MFQCAGSEKQDKLQKLRREESPDLNLEYNLNDAFNYFISHEMIMFIVEMSIFAKAD